MTNRVTPGNFHEPGQPNRVDTARTAWGGRLLLGELDGRADFPDPDENLRAQLSGRRITAAVLLHHALYYFFQAVFTQAGAALVEVLADLRAVHVVFEVAIDPVQHLGTRRLVRVSAAHRASSPATEASEPVFARPRSDA